MTKVNRAYPNTQMDVHRIEGIPDNGWIMTPGTVLCSARYVRDIHSLFVAVAIQVAVALAELGAVPRR